VGGWMDGACSIYTQLWLKVVKGIGYLEELGYKILG
jgi:hypothetical protein